MNPIGLINALISEVEALPFADWDSLDAVKRRTEMVTRNIFGSDSKYLQDLKDIGFSSIVFGGERDTELDRSIWESGRQRFINLLSTMIEELQLFSDQPESSSVELTTPPMSLNSREIFVVHGHDEAMKISVARVLERLNLSPVILHERPNQGRTIIEKFTDYADVNFSVVLL